MDSQDAIAKHSRLLSWFEQERERQMENRREMALDCDFYDGLQWNWEDAQVLIERNQSPLVYNLTKPTVDWIIGSERRLRVDWRVLPRMDTTVESAGIKTKVLKYLSDVNKTPFQRSRAFEDSVKAGVGWVEDGVTLDPTMESIYSRYESWRYIWFDSFGLELDQSDWRYMFRVKSLDTDVGAAFFPRPGERHQARVLRAAHRSRRGGRGLLVSRRAVFARQGSVVYGGGLDPPRVVHGHERRRRAPRARAPVRVLVPRADDRAGRGRRRSSRLHP
jgi:hypothetical protein